MMKTILSVLLFASTAIAVPQHWTPWPPTGTLYLIQSICPGTCYPLVDQSGNMLDVQVAMLSGSTLVVDPVKQAAKDAALAQVQAALLQAQVDASRKEELKLKAKTKKLSADEIQELLSFLK